MNFIKGVSGGDPSMTRRAYSLRIDKFVRDIKASFRSLGHSIVKLEYELTQFRFLQKAKPPSFAVSLRKADSTLSSGAFDHLRQRPKQPL